LEEPVTPKPIPLVIPYIGIGTWVTLIDNVTHASEVFKTPDTTLKDTPITKKPKSKPIPLVELFDIKVNNMLMI
jgi:hypothetical protein